MIQLNEVRLQRDGESHKNDQLEKRLSQREAALRDLQQDKEDLEQALTRKRQKLGDLSAQLRVVEEELQQKEADCENKGRVLERTMQASEDLKRENHKLGLKLRQI